ncbi:MAG: ATP-binding protein [Butyricicoccus sp.]|nr:ATP-binding protein [Butyricicoccus sp.]
MDRQEAELLFRLISERYEHGSIILTSNQYFSHWGNCSAPISWPPLGGLSFE